jgi:hypothetical protein
LAIVGIFKFLVVTTEVLIILSDKDFSFYYEVFYLLQPISSSNRAINAVQPV